MEEETKKESGEGWRTIEPNVWKFENEGDQVIGKLVSKEPKTAEMSAKYHIDTGDDTVLVWGSAIIDDRMKFVNVGDRIRITFVERTKNKKNQDLNMFRIDVAG